MGMVVCRKACMIRFESGAASLFQQVILRPRSHVVDLNLPPGLNEVGHDPRPYSIKSSFFVVINTHGHF
jgi:hypothetical protein